MVTINLETSEKKVFNGEAFKFALTEGREEALMLLMNKKPTETEHIIQLEVQKNMRKIDPVELVSGDNWENDFNDISKKVIEIINEVKQ